MHTNKIMTAEIQKSLDQLIGKEISKVWRGYGATIFLELGKLSKDPKGDLKGESCIMIEWSWRVENKRSILFGSFSTDRKIDNQLQKLTGKTIKTIRITGRLPEIEIELENNQWIHSFQTSEGQPDWCIFMADRYFAVERGIIKTTFYERK